MITSLCFNIHHFFSNFAMTTSAVPLAVYYVTASTQEEAEKLSTILLNSKLIACCNIVKDVKSIYEWEGKVENSAEVLMIMKSRQELLEKITEVVQKNHSYDTPEVIAMPILGGS